MNCHDTTLSNADQISSIGSASRRPKPPGPVPALSPPRGRSPARPSTSAVDLEEFRSAIRSALDHDVDPAELASVIARGVS